MASSRLLDQVRDRIRVKRYSLRTQDAYLHSIRRVIFFHEKKHSREMGGPHVEAFLSRLATRDRISAATQNQALSALLFLYREVLHVDLPWLDGVVRAKRPEHVPVVLTENELRALLARLEGTRWLVVGLLYSSAMCLLEGLRQRVKDVDFERREITVRDGIDALRRSDLTELPITLEHARATQALPLLHRDPFDRMLVAQAQSEGLSLVSRDPAIRRYQVTVLWDLEVRAPRAAYAAKRKPRRR